MGRPLCDNLGNYLRCEKTHRVNCIQFQRRNCTCQGCQWNSHPMSWWKKQILFRMEIVQNMMGSEKHDQILMKTIITIDELLGLWSLLFAFVRLARKWKYDTRALHICTLKYYNQELTQKFSRKKNGVTFHSRHFACVPLVLAGKSKVKYFLNALCLYHILYTFSCLHVCVLTRALVNKRFNSAVLVSTEANHNVVLFCCALRRVIMPISRPGSVSLWYY